MDRLSFWTLRGLERIGVSEEVGDSDQELISDRNPFRDQWLGHDLDQLLDKPVMSGWPYIGSA